MSQWHSRFVSPVYVGSCGGHACNDSARAHRRLRRVSFLSTALDLNVCVCVCVCEREREREREREVVCVRARLRVCVCVCARTSVCVCGWVGVYFSPDTGEL